MEASIESPIQEIATLLNFKYEKKEVYRHYPVRDLVRRINREKDTIKLILEKGGYSIEDNLPMQLNKIAKDKLTRDKWDESLYLSHKSIPKKYIEENMWQRKNITRRKKENQEKRKAAENKATLLNQLDLTFLFPSKGEQYKDLLIELYNSNTHHNCIESINHILKRIIDLTDGIKKTHGKELTIGEIKEIDWQKVVNNINRDEIFIENIEFFFEEVLSGESINRFGINLGLYNDLQDKNYKKYRIEQINFDNMSEKFRKGDDNTFIECGIEKKNVEIAKLLIEHPAHLSNNGEYINKFCSLVDTENILLFKEIYWELCCNKQDLNLIEKINLIKIKRLALVTNDSNIKYLSDTLHKDPLNFINSINSGLLEEILSEKSI